MIKIFSFICAILIFSTSYSYASSKDAHLRVSTIDVDYSSFHQNIDGDEVLHKNFYDSKTMLHPPILVEYYGKKSILLFLPSVEGSSERQGIILHYSLDNNKMNVVGFIHGGDEEILAVFGYEFSEKDASILVLTKNYDPTDDTFSYSTFTNSISNSNDGLYITQFKPDTISNPYLTNCIDGGTDYLGNKRVCKYKDAASIRQFFDTKRKEE